MLRIRRIWRNLRGYDALAFVFHLVSHLSPHCGEGYATTTFRQVYSFFAVYVNGTHWYLCCAQHKYQNAAPCGAVSCGGCCLVLLFLALHGPHPVNLCRQEPIPHVVPARRKLLDLLPRLFRPLDITVQ